MTHTQQPEALRLADCLKGNATTPWTREEAAAELCHMYAKNQSLQSEAIDNARIIGASAETELALRARIEELKRELKAIGAGGVEPLRKHASQQAAHHAEGVPAQTETLLAELAEETEAAENWRRLALQFDHHRLQALGHLKAILHPDSSVDEYKTAELFLKAPPLDGESVLAQRIAKLSAAATQAQEDAPVGFAWSGWACMYPGKLPRLYGALEIASVNLDAANGDQLIHLSTSPDPKAQADTRDAARYRYLRETDRYFSDDKDGAIYVRQVGITSGVITGSTILTDEELDAAIDAALAAQAKKGGAA